MASNKIPVVQLGEPLSRAMLQKQLEEKLPLLAERLKDLPPGDEHELRGQVIATRQMGREFVTAHPEIDGPVQIDCMWAEVLSPTVVHEILKAWPEATFFNCNEDAAESIAVVRGRL